MVLALPANFWLVALERSAIRGFLSLEPASSTDLVQGHREKAPARSGSGFNT